MWPFKERVSASALVRELVADIEKEKQFLSQFGFEVSDLHVLLLRHALLLLTVRFLPVSGLWEQAIGDSLALICAEHDPDNELRLGLALYQYPCDENPFSSASFDRERKSVSRPIAKAVECFYALNSLHPDRLQILTHAVMAQGIVIAHANFISDIEKTMKIVQ